MQQNAENTTVTFIHRDGFKPVKPRLIYWIFVYVLAAQTSTGQASPEFKTVRQRVWKNNSRDFKKSGYFTKLSIGT